MVFEMNNVRKDADIFSGTFTKNSPIVEVFAAMVNGASLDKFGKVADKSVEYIKNLGVRAEAGDVSAVAELNTLRRFVLEPKIMEEAKLLGIFGSYQNVGYDETIEREVWKPVGQMSREQAASGDVVFPMIEKETYPVPTFTVSGGYQVDYRRVAMGDMEKENEGMAMVRTDIMNRAKLAIVKKVYAAIMATTGVKYAKSFSSLTKDGVDKILNAVRRNGRPTVIADYAILSQFSNWAGYATTLGTVNVAGVSEKTMNEIAANGLLSTYNGAILSEMANPYDYYGGIVTDAQGDKNYKTVLPAGLAFVVPAGVNSPVATYTRGGLTSFTGNDVKTGKILTRFDLEVGCDVAKGHEDQIGLFVDEQLTDMSAL